jgi:hypothetical protein
VVTGSVAATLAFLVRQQGLLIPVAVVTFLVVTGRLRRAGTPLRLLMQVAGLPVAGAAVYLVWFNVVHEVGGASAQENYFDSWADAGVGGIATMIGRIGFLDAMFAGFFVLPVGLAALPRVRALARSMTRRGWSTVGAIVACVVVAAAFYPGRMRVPLTPHFITNEGLGPSGDLHGGRLPLVPGGAQTVVTVACVAAAAILLVALGAQLHGLRRRENAAATLVLCVLGWQAIGVLVPSVVLRDTTISYDRYFLPLLPLAVCVALWALRPVGINLPIAVGVTGVLAVTSVAATHDFLEYQSAAWRMARAARAAGVPVDRLDGGAAWDGRYLYERSLRERIKPVFPTDLPPGPLRLSEHDVDPWWLNYYAPAAAENDYIVSAEPLAGFTVVRSIEYPSWLGRARTYMYLLRHPDASGPP